MKACWTIFKQPESFWNRLLCAKYKFEPLLGFDLCTSTSCTPFWRLVCNSWPKMREETIWELGRGRRVQFWNHRWIPILDGPLSEVATQRIPDYLLLKTVDYFAENASWEWSKFQHLLPEEVVNIIAAIMPPGEAQGDDVVFWGPSPSGTFSIKSAYEGMGAHQSVQQVVPWGRIWSWYWPQRIKMFFWMLLNNGVLTNKERNRRRLSETDSCNMCGCGTESSLHMLRDCTDAIRTWKDIMRYGGEERFFEQSLSLTDWLIQNISSKSLMGNGLRWSIIFGIGCWQIWKKRCDFILKGIRRGPEVVMIEIINMAKWVVEARIVDDRALGISRSPILVSWRPQSRDTLKLNTDASLEGGSGRTFGGGLFRDDLGVWRYVFVANVGKCSILTAELWCILYGLQLAKDLGFRKLEWRVIVLLEYQ